MSFAMDDVGLNKVLQKLQTVLFERKTTGTNTEASTETTQSEPVYTEDVKISESLTKRLKTVQNDLESTQKGLNILEKADEGLSSVSDKLENIKKNTQKIADGGLTDKEIEDLNKKIKDDMKSIDKISEETKFNDKKLLDGSSYDKTTVSTEESGDINISKGLKSTSTKSLDLPESKDLSIKSEKEAEEFLKKVGNAQKQIEKQQDTIDTDQSKILKTVSNLIVLNEGLDSADAAIKNTSEINSSIKEAAVQGIINNPANTIKAQVKNLDENIILALMSMHGLQH